VATVRLIAVGSRMPGWVREAYDDYVSRLSSGLRIALTEIAPAARNLSRSREKNIELEADKILGALRGNEYVVALDEHGTEKSTRELAAWLTERQREGRDIAFVIGGPDGLSPRVSARSEFTWSLSRLTFPHALVRVVLAEQLYRAHSLLANHPYHRD
jgi:23S rRNA (pseudouridine1915-N3)-methyltransferase